MLAWMEGQVSPVLEWTGTEELRLLHRSEKRREIILLANPSLKELEGNMVTGFQGRVSFWDASDGMVVDLGRHARGEAIKIKIPAESAGFIVVE